MKGSKDPDFRIISNKNLSQKIHCSTWHLGQNGLNLPHLWCHPHKTWNPKLSNFFKC